MSGKKTENMLEYMKEYREKNAGYWKQKVRCEICNKTMTLSSRSHHKKSTKHLFNEMKIKMAAISRNNVQKENNSNECEKDNNSQECDNNNNNQGAKK